MLTRVPGGRGSLLMIKRDAPVAAKPFITRVELEPDIRAVLKSASRRTGMTQVAVLSRIADWYAKQPPDIQSRILLRDSLRDDNELTKLIVQGWADANSRRSFRSR